MWEVVGIGRWGYSPKSRVPSSGFSTIYPLYPEHIRRRVSSVVEHSSANPKVPGSIPGSVSYQVHGL